MNGSAWIVWTDEWPHDLWIAQGMQTFPGGGMAQTWRHRSAIDDWPLLDADETPVTASGALDRIIDAAETPLDDHEELLHRLYSYTVDFNTLSTHRRRAPDPRLVKGVIVRTWLRTTVGPGLGGLLLGTDDPNLTRDAVSERLQLIWQLTARFEHPHLDVVRATSALYSANWVEHRPVVVPTLQGQPHTVRDLWHWLGSSIPDEEMLEGVRLAAGLLTSPPLLEALTTAAGRDDDVALLALCVLRRWVLGLRALSWLEAAVGQPWRDVRTIDLMAFAHASLGPWWPRPSLAISHHSRDAKPLLTELDVWGDAAVAIDALTIPTRETNTGFVWRLFAPTPSIIRIRSAAYGTSIWCRREAELTQYLLDTSDFLRGRSVIDVELANASSLAAPLEPADAPSLDPPFEHSGSQDFPPHSMVLDIPELPPLVVELLAAAATLRLLNGLLGDVRVVNEIASRLSAGTAIELPPPTIDPDGWAMHYKTFGTLARVSGQEQQTHTVALSLDYPPAQLELDRELMLRFPDPQISVCSGTELLAAMEWDRTMRRWYSEGWGGSYLGVVDCRDIDVQRWSDDPAQALRRGVVELASDMQVFVVQDAGQHVERWPVIRDRDTPILTQHVPEQLKWMVLTRIVPTWLAAYVSLAELRIAPSVVEAAFAALAEEFAAWTGLTTPATYDDVFMIDYPPGSPLRMTSSHAEGPWGRCWSRLRATEVEAIIGFFPSGSTAGSG